jgi:cytidine deaminase
MFGPILVDLRTQSRDVCRNAYAPYSGFSVGVAVLFDGSSQIFTGTNVENQSYGLTICAERSAIFAGVSAGLRKLTHVAITCRDKHGNLVAANPCGACLQVIAEFGTRETQIILADGAKRYLHEFLPQPFGL